jgi:hypothetical protein
MVPIGTIMEKWPKVSVHAVFAMAKKKDALFAFLAVFAHPLAAAQVLNICCVNLALKKEKRNRVVATAAALSPVLLPKQQLLPLKLALLAVVVMQCENGYLLRHRSTLLASIGVPTFCRIPCLVPRRLQINVNSGVASILLFEV